MFLVVPPLLSGGFLSQIARIITDCTDYHRLYGLSQISRIRLILTDDTDFRVISPISLGWGFFTLLITHNFCRILFAIRLYGY